MIPTGILMLKQLRQLTLGRSRTMPYLLWGGIKMTLLLGLSIGIGLFLCAFLGFREGLRLGMNVSKGNDIKPFKTPIRVIQEHKTNKEVEKANKEFQDELNALMSYTGDEPEG
ncbi:MAG TPA: hypothetical protein P5215_06240 [Bacteroidales bacterium]|nr:hypothetical protein [Bacteroidales bacterium]